MKTTKQLSGRFSETSETVTALHPEGSHLHVLTSVADSRPQDVPDGPNAVERNSFCFSGEFPCHSGKLSLCSLTDPYTIDDGSAFSALSYPYFPHICLDSAPKGTWLIYRETDSQGSPKGVLIVPEQLVYSIPEPLVHKDKKGWGGFLSALSRIFIANTGKKHAKKRTSSSVLSYSPFFVSGNPDIPDIFKETCVDNIKRHQLSAYPAGSIFCITDAPYASLSAVCESELEEDAVYSPSDLLKILPQAPYDPVIKEALYDYLYLRLEKGRYALGCHMKNIVSGSGICWDGFRSHRVSSTHWNVDMLRRSRGGSACTLVPGGFSFQLAKSSSPLILEMRTPDGTLAAVRLLAP